MQAKTRLHALALLDHFKGRPVPYGASVDDINLPRLIASAHTYKTQTLIGYIVIVVGAGLSGLSAAHTVYLNGGNVLLLDKNSKRSPGYNIGSK